MGKYLKEREPLTENEVWEYLNKEVEKQAKHWGKDYIYTEWAREARDKKMQEWKEGKVVLVHIEKYVDSYGNGCGDYEDELYSDGTVKTACYGYLD